MITLHERIESQRNYVDRLVKQAALQSVDAHTVAHAQEILTLYEDAARFRKLNRAFSLIVLKNVDRSKLVTISVQWNQDSTDLEATTGETLLDAVDKLKGPQA